MATVLMPSNPNFPPEKRELFVKIAGKTGSDQDGEALTAVRMANQMLRSHGLTWDGIIIRSEPAPIPHNVRQELEGMLWRERQARVEAEEKVEQLEKQLAAKTARPRKSTAKCEH